MNMNELNLSSVTKYVEDHIGTFHQKRIQSLDSLKLTKVLKRKNPYLFRAKYVLTSEEIVRGIVDAHISSNEETIFGDWLENLAIFINKEVYGGWKSSAEGVDLEFDKDDIRYVVAIKSGPNWGNSSQIKKMRADFARAERVIRTSNSKLHIIKVNGCCYGQDKNPDKGDYFKLCGQDFWEFISGQNTLYTDIIEPLGHMAKEKNEDFLLAYSKLLNKFTLEFSQNYCFPDGGIDWVKIVRLNSSRK